jgi:arsenical pump membrane protein
VVLTFTPFICYFAKHARIDPVPYLVCEFVAANTWSMALIIGNPTNIYLAASAGVGFAEYLTVMLLPTVMAGIVSLGMLWVLFHRRLCTPMEPAEHVEHIEDKPTVTLSIFALGSCILLMVFSSYADIPMWLIAAFSCLSLYLVVIPELLWRHRTLSPVTHSLLRAPFDVIPFVLSMFVLVMGLEDVGVTSRLSAFLLGEGEILRVGVGSFLAANLVNNIPMSVLFSSVVSPVGGALHPGALYAAVIGSNIGAFFTPLGALAGIMWMALLKQHHVKLSFGKFVALGALISIPTLLASLAGLALVL